MRRVIQFNVDNLGVETKSILQGKDTELVDSYLLPSGSFTNRESRLDVTFYDLDDNKLETVPDVNWYTILGTNKKDEAQQIQVNPVECAQEAGYVDGDVVVKFEPYDFLFYRGASLYISDISVDRTEIRVQSLVLSEEDLRAGIQNLYSRFNEKPYFSEAYLDFRNLEEKPVCVNAMLEVIDGKLVATLKLYSPLPLEVVEKDSFEILLPLGEPTLYRVTRTETWEEEPPKRLKGPNFNVDLGTSKTTTPYISYGDLLGSGRTENVFKQNIDASLDHSNFANFVHFSSAVERLENARYKFERIWDYEELEAASVTPLDKDRYKTQIQNIIANFDHYEQYLYYERGPRCWPKDVDGKLLKPGDIILESWWENIVEEATAYDEFNVDILTNSIPHTLRDNTDNDPYTLFVHMIGQHFDDIWIYIKALAKKYNADNRVGFGVSKDLVKQAIHDFGISLYESNESLNALFELSRKVTLPEKVGDEYAVKDYIQLEGTNPSTKDSYNKELWKRIYHNIPTLIKAKGTGRGLRVLINCFGIPDDILDVKVAGGINREVLPFFGPEEFVNSGSVGQELKVRLDSPDKPVQDYIISGSTGFPFAKRVLTQDIKTNNPVVRRSDDIHHVEVGFNLGKEQEEFVKSNLPDFNFDDEYGDPGNREESYGRRYGAFIESLYEGLPEDRFRTPAAIIRLVRYFDAALFRSLLDFVAARSTISTGAIVRDNFLHRSRWPGVELSAIQETYSGSLQIGSIEGSSGQSIEAVGSTKHEIITSNGKAYIPKQIDDESPWYNGELDGSELEITDGWLTRQNPHNKGNRASGYAFRFYFIDLPEPPYCIIAAWDTYYNSHIFYIRTDEGVVSQGFTKYHEGSPYAAEYKFSSRSEEVSVEANPVGRTRAYAGGPVTGYQFIGWYEGLTEPANNLLGLKAGGWLSNPRQRVWKVTSLEKQQALYRDVAGRIRLQVIHAGEGIGYSEYYYKPGDLIILFTQMGPNGITPVPFDQLGNLEIVLDTSVGKFRGEISTANLIGYANPGDIFTSVAHIEGIRSQADVLKFGFSGVRSGHVGGYQNSNNYYNADWYDTWDEWKDWRWTVDYKFVQWAGSETGLPSTRINLTPYTE